MHIRGLPYSAGADTKIRWFIHEFLETSFFDRDVNEIVMERSILAIDAKLIYLIQQMRSHPVMNSS